MATFKLEILTPYGHYYNGEVDYLSLKNDDGVLGILPKHTPIITTVSLCKILVVIKGNRHLYATTGGVLNVKKDGTVSLLVQTIERSDEIDLERAKRAKKRAEDRIKDNRGDMKRAENALLRAENRIQVAEDKSK